MCTEGRAAYVRSQDRAPTPVVFRELMLLDLPGGKADRMVCRFVATALGQPEAAVSQGYAAELVYAAADALGVDARHLDFNIWNYQRGQG